MKIITVTCDYDKIPLGIAVVNDAVADEALARVKKAAGDLGFFNIGMFTALTVDELIDEIDDVNKGDEDDEG